MTQADVPRQRQDGLAGVLGPLEAEVMDVLWALGKGTVGDVLEHGGIRRSYATVKTVMERLARKGLLRRRLEGKAYVYEPAEPRSALEARISRQMAQRLLAGFGSHAISQFADVLREDPRRLQEMRALLEMMAREDAGGAPGVTPGTGASPEGDDHAGAPA